MRPYLSSKAKTATGAVDRACAGRSIIKTRPPNRLPLRDSAGLRPASSIKPCEGRFRRACKFSVWGMMDYSGRRCQGAGWRIRRLIVRTVCQSIRLFQPARRRCERGEPERWAALETEGESETTNPDSDCLRSRLGFARRANGGGRIRIPAFGGNGGRKEALSPQSQALG